MSRTRLGLLSFLCVSIASAQLPANFSVPHFKTNLFALSFMESTSSQWAQGSQNFIAAKISIRQHIRDSLGPLRAVNTLTVDLGVRQTGDSSDVAPVRIGENEFFAESRWMWPCGWSIDPYCCANVRSPLTESFRYSDHPERTANLWDPVVSFESLGLQYILSMRSAMIIVRGGVALKQTRAHDHTLLTDNLFTQEIERYKAESGIEFIGDATFARDSTILYVGRLALFGTFNAPAVWTVRWENELRYRIWKFIGLTMSLQIIYNAAESLKTQLRQSAMVTFFGDS